jgi:hypothetical protein
MTNIVAVLAAKADGFRGGLDKGGLGEDAYRKRLADTQRVLDALGGLRRSEPTGAARDLANAHDELVPTIDDSDSSRAAFLKSVGDFADKMSSLETALKALSPRAGC